jgi:hypothetical protein
MRPNLQSLVASTTRTVRRDAFLAIAGAIAALAAITLLAAWALSGFERWPAPSPWPLTLELITVAAVGLLVFLALKRLRRSTTEQNIAAAGEEALGLPAGSVRGVLELSREVPNGTSPALYRSAHARLDASFPTWMAAGSVVLSRPARGGAACRAGGSRPCSSSSP